MKYASLLSLLLLAPIATACGRHASAEEQSQPMTDGTFAISVDSSGYHPGAIHAKAGSPARLVFTRTSDEGCGQQVVFPAMGIRKDLPLNQPVAVDITMPNAGSIAFTCGMNMLRGSVVAE